MPRNRFEALHQHIQYSNTQMMENLSQCNQSDERWDLVLAFVNAINVHREKSFTPSDRICVDESISKWYDLGGSWSDIGLPRYVAIQRKPESGCELQTSSCGESGIMIRIKVVMGSSSAPQTTSTQTEELSASAETTLDLIKPWLNTNRIVCADSYFSSVKTAEELLRRNTKYIGIIKQGTKKFPKDLLETHVVKGRGTCVDGVVE